QAAVLAPIAGTQGLVTTQADSGERTTRPYLEGRVRLGWGPTDDPSEVAIGGHVGWLRGLDSLTGDSLLQSRAVTFDTRLKFGPAELLGEAFIGQSIAGLGGGAIGQNAGVAGARCAPRADGTIESAAADRVGVRRRLWHRRSEGRRRPAQRPVPQFRVRGTCRMASAWPAAP